MRFPLRDVITPRTTPVVTWGLIAITTVLALVWFNAISLAGNMVALWIFGENVEDQAGRGRFLALFLACGAAGALAHAWLNPLAPVPPAVTNGAVAGVMGAYFVMFFHSRVLVRVPFAVLEVPALFFLALWCLLHVLASLGLGASAFAAHATGLLSGAAIIRLVRRPERARWEWREH
jgi:membrane associated rhomboid family serine protease